MVPPPDAETEGLLSRAAEGDAAAVNDLMGRHRGRLQRMVAVRMDKRLARRIGPSDVVQETMVEASRRLPAYLKGQPIPSDPWLHRLAWNRLVHLYCYHVEGARRSVSREAASGMGVSDESVMALAGRLATSGTSPGRNVLRRDFRERVSAASEWLPERYREVVIMRHLEQLSVEEIAHVA
jgi:RNA polymerase sigma-70 factor (ECF subfamily)